MTTITLELPDELAQQLQQFDIETVAKGLKQWVVWYQQTQQESLRGYLPLLDATTPLPPIVTLADLLTHGYGAWADRDEVADPIEYAYQLRKQAWQRQP